MNSSVYCVAQAAQRKSAAWSWLNKNDIDDINAVGAGTLPKRLNPQLGRQVMDAQNERAQLALRDNRWGAVKNLGLMAGATGVGLSSAMVNPLVPAALPLAIAGYGGYGVSQGVRLMRGQDAFFGQVAPVYANNSNSNNSIGNSSVADATNNQANTPQTMAADTTQSIQGGNTRPSLQSIISGWKAKSRDLRMRQIRKAQLDAQMNEINRLRSLPLGVGERLLSTKPSFVPPRSAYKGEWPIKKTYDIPLVTGTKWWGGEAKHTLRPAADNNN